MKFRKSKINNRNSKKLSRICNRDGSGILGAERGDGASGCVATEA